jgi:hypothetical protein
LESGLLSRKISLNPAPDLALPFEAEGRTMIARSAAIRAHWSNVSAAHQDLERFETRLLPALTRSYPCHFTFYVAEPLSSIRVSPLN